MGKALRVLGILVGVLLLVVGVAVAVYVGPDNQVQRARHQVGPPEAPVMGRRGSQANRKDFWSSRPSSVADARDAGRHDACLPAAGRMAR